MAQPVGGGPEISDLSARHEHEQPIADVEVRDAVRDHDNRPPVAGEAGHHLHHRHVQARVQTGRGLVQEQQRRLRQQLKGDVDALLLAAGKRRRTRIGVRRQRQLAEHLIDPSRPLGRAGVAREPEFGRIPQRTVRGQLRMQDVLLGHQADPVPQFGVVGVKIAPVVEHRACGGWPHAGQRAEQSRLAGAARPDHTQQAPLAKREADVVQQHLAVGQRDGESAGVE